jgi:hypothetical protein
MKPISMTHAELVIRAERWLRNSMRCGVVLTEASGGGIEIPDAIGWTGRFSHLVECKTSRSDFLADRRKVFRQWACDDTLGYYRWFMVPAGLIEPTDVLPRWGLLEVRTNSVRKTVKAKPWNLDRQGSTVRLGNELGLMFSELRKIQIVQGGDRLLPSKAGRRVEALVAMTAKDRGEVAEEN